MYNGMCDAKLCLFIMSSQDVIKLTIPFWFSFGLEVWDLIVSVSIMWGIIFYQFSITCVFVAC